MGSLHIVNYEFVRVISRKAIKQFSEKHSDAGPSLNNWFLITRRAKWADLAELKRDFATADQVGRRTVFNVGGNKYRLIARVNYRTQKVFVLRIMKHSEYTKGDWRKE